MRRQSTTVRITREVLALMNDYVKHTRNGVIYRWKGGEYGHCPDNTMLNCVSGKTLAKCTIKKSTLAHMVSDLAAMGITEWSDRIFKQNTGLGNIECLVQSQHNHGYVPTISGDHWHHHVLMVVTVSHGLEYFRGGAFHDTYACK